MPENSLLTKLESIRSRYESLQQQLSDPSLVQDMKRYVSLNKEYAEIEPIIQAGEKYRNAIHNLSSAKELLLTEKDEEMREFAKEEIALLEEKIPDMEQQIKFLLIPADPQIAKCHYGNSGGAGGMKLDLAGTCSECTANLQKRKDGNWRSPECRKELQAV